MIVITLNVCPPALRGDLTKWLFEINTGVYVGNVSARVRDKLWARVCDHVKDGRATMVFSANNEQHLDFRVHNSQWEPVDFDGLKLMMRPAQPCTTAFPQAKKNFSRAAKMNMARRADRRAVQPPPRTKERYILIDLETTGLSEDTANIIEICAMKVEENEVISEYHAYIRQDGPLPPKIVQLTGITDEVLQQEGIPRREAIQHLLLFLGEDRLVSHNVRFDQRFLCAACRAESLPEPTNPTIDTLAMARERLSGLANYRLSTVAEHLSILPTASHTSRGDCLTTKAVYEALLKRDQEAAGSNPATSTIETPCKPLICKELSYFRFSLIVPPHTRLFLAMTNSVTITVTNEKRGPEGPLSYLIPCNFLCHFLAALWPAEWAAFRSSSRSPSVMLSHIFPLLTR